jgi:Fic family protein
MLHDTYESLTIEGYDVSKEDITIIVNWSEKKYPQKISSKIDIEWYLDSYKIVTNKIKQEYWKPSLIDNNLFFDINLTLFSYYPVAKKYDIPRAYRKENIRISGTSYLPPSHILVDEYMKRFISFINNLNISDSKDIIRSAILSHFFFVHIHPFSDGNGRTWRLLMNYIFGVNKYQGITISHKDREVYIAWLKEASENDNIVPFIQFMMNQLWSL